VPWIPIEDYSDLNKCRSNLKGDIWAYATTLWEIFSRGASLIDMLGSEHIMDFFLRGDRPPKPPEWLYDANY
jgi:Protein tyrosine and serine/threonine kinase